MSSAAAGESASLDPALQDRTDGAAPTTSARSPGPEGEDSSRCAGAGPGARGFDEEDNQPHNGVAADLCDGTQEDDTCSPMGSANKRASTSSKRASSIGCTGESPSKKTKSPMVKALRGLVNEIKIHREEGKKKEDNYAKREEARSSAMQWMAATMDQWEEEDEEEEEQEAAATERRKNIIFSAAQIIA
ncbi:hypothetical protein ZWY2020_003436 [Hordeum vulgare]|nr:hypothetical protein ZWY2020_003436 [Hordeum vulgare]